MDTDRVDCTLRPGCSVAGLYVKRDLWPDDPNLVREKVASAVTLWHPGHVNGITPILLEELWTPF